MRYGTYVGRRDGYLHDAVTHTELFDGDGLRVLPLLATRSLGGVGGVKQHCGLFRVAGAHVEGVFAIVTVDTTGVDLSIDATRFAAVPSVPRAFGDIVGLIAMSIR